MLLEYSQLTTDDLKSKYLTNALIELKGSLAAHKSLDSLKSREQYYEFITALYKTSCVFKYSQHEKHPDLKLISMVLFDHYCRNQTTIVHDDKSVMYINRAMNILNLQSYTEVNPSTDSSTGYFSPELSRAVISKEGML